MNNKKGQAAMEFLMTYGWAILAAVIAIAALWYMGVFTPETKDTIIINAPFGGEAEMAVTADSIRVITNNGAGDRMTITNFAIAGCGANDTEMIFESGAKVDVTVTCSPAISVSKFTGAITVTYLKAGRELPETATGSITAKVA